MYFLLKILGRSLLDSFLKSRIKRVDPLRKNISLPHLQKKTFIRAVLQEPSPLINSKHLNFQLGIDSVLECGDSDNHTQLYLIQPWPCSCFPSYKMDIIASTKKHGFTQPNSVNDFTLFFW